MRPTPEWVNNVRPAPNPNFVDIGLGSYMRALLDQHEFSADDTFIIMCQSGWRASFAATAIKNLPQFGNANVQVLYGGMLDWTDDFSGTGNHDNVPGPAARPRTHYGDITFPPDLSDLIGLLGGASGNQYGNSSDLGKGDPKYNYDIARLVEDGQVPIWDGKESHVGVKPEWMLGFGATDFKLSLDSGRAYWASMADFQNRVLSVDYSISNNMPDAPGPLNYPESCGGAPIPEGSCMPVLQDLWGPSYNTKIMQAPSTNGVKAVNLPADVNVLGLDTSSLPDLRLPNPGGITGLPLPETPTNLSASGLLPPALTGIGTVKYNVPAGIMYFNSNPIVVSNDVPDPKGTLFGPTFEFYFTYTYNHFGYDVKGLPAEPSGGLLGGGGPLGGLPVVGSLLGGGGGSLPQVGDILGGGVGGLPVVGDLGGIGGLPIVGDFLGSLPIIGDLLGGGDLVDNLLGLVNGLPIVGDILGGGGLPPIGDPGDLPVVGDLLGGGVGGLPVVGDLLGGGSAGGSASVDAYGNAGGASASGSASGSAGGSSASGSASAGAGSTGPSLPVVGDVLSGTGSLPVVGDVLSGDGSLPLVGDVLGGNSSPPVVGGLLGLLLGL